MASARVRSTLRAAWLCGSIGAGWFLPQLTAAQVGAPAPGSLPPSQLSLRLRPCPDAPYDAQALGQLLQVELRSLGVTTLHSESPDSEVSAAKLAVVQLGCGSAPATLSVELADLVSGNRVVRELVVSDVEPAARARMLSIAIASLLESSWTLLAARPPAIPGLPASVRAALLRRLGESLPPPAVSAEPIEIPEPAPSPSEPLLFSIALSGLSFPSHATGLIGLDFALFPSLASNLRVSVELSGAYGRHELQDSSGPIAELQLLWLSAGTGLYFTSQSLPQLLLGPLIRLAYVRTLTELERDGFTEVDADGYAIELGVGAWLRAELSSHWDGYVGCEIGYVPNGATFVADGTRAISVEGVLIVLRVGVGTRY
jgi:hypothetical protein